MQKRLILFLVLLINSGICLVAQGLDSLKSRVYSWSAITETKTASPNIPVQVFEGSTYSLARFNVEIAMLKRGAVFPQPRVLAGMEQLVIIKDGQLDITINGQTRTLGRGSIAYFMPGEENRIVNKGKMPATFYVLKYQSKNPADSGQVKQQGGSFMMDWKEAEFKPHDKGGRKDFFNRSTSQLKKFEMHTTALNAGKDSHAPHIHIQEEIILLLKGDVKMHIDGKLYPAVAGDIVFLAAGVPHALLNTGTEQAEYFAFQWSN